MAGAATCAPLILQALLSGSVSSETAMTLRMLYTTSSVRVVRWGLCRLGLEGPFYPFAADYVSSAR